MCLPAAVTRPLVHMECLSLLMVIIFLPSRGYIVDDSYSGCGNHNFKFGDFCE